MSTKDEREKRRSTFSASKQALLEKRLQGIAKHEGTPVTIPKRPEKEKAPASFSQQRLWFLQQLEPDNSAYNETRTVHITLPLERDSLKQALCEIMRRHEILRTNIVLVDGQVQQVIHPYEEALHRFSLHEFDLQEVAAEEQKIAVDQYLKAFVRQPFDLAKNMLWKVTWIRIGPEDNILVLVIHHILCDGWGLDIFETEIRTLYEMFRREESSPLPELVIQYADFAYWQQHYLKTEHLEQQLTYWRHILSNLPEQQLLRGENHPPQHEQGSAGARLSFTVPSTITQQLQALSFQEGVTLFMTLLAAFQILLCHYSEQTDILVGSPIANRMRPEFEPLIGCFINTLILRTNLSGNPTVRELLQRVRETALGAYAHQDVPFEKLVEELSPKRELHRNPFFQVLFTFQNYQQTSANPALPSGNTTDWQVDSISSKFDLDLMMWESEGTLRGDFSYNSGLFAASTIVHIQQHFLMVLSDIAGAKHLLDIPGLTEAERLEYSAWNNSAVIVLPSDTSTPSLDEGPHSPLEEILLMLWAEMLEKEQITIHTNFFDAGGYSLQATRLLARIQDVLAIEIPLRLIFDAPTVTSFAEALLKDECQREQIEKNIELMLSVAQLSEDEVATMLQETE